MYPPPMTTIFFGTSFSFKAPVEETIFSSSISRPGSGVTSDPVAMITFLARSVVPGADLDLRRGLERCPPSDVADLVLLEKALDPFRETRDGGVLLGHHLGDVDRGARDHHAVVLGVLGGGLVDVGGVEEGLFG